MKVAITGSTGFVGGNVAKILIEYGHEVVGLVRRPEQLPWEAREVDFSSIDSIASSLADCNAVVHCAIANDFNRLVEDRPYAYDSFVGMTSRVVQAAHRNGLKPLYISTDWVLDGESHLTNESDPGNPLNIYGFLKAMGEQVIRDLAPENGAICRIGGVMGFHQTKLEGPRSQDVGFGYFVTSLVADLKAGKQFIVWGGDRVNKIATPSLAAEIGAQIERVIALDASGTFHLVGDDAVSRLELAQLVCDVFELDMNLLGEGLPPESELFAAAVPVDTSLSNRETKRALKLNPTSLRDLLLCLKAELETGRIQAMTKPIR